MSDDLLGDDTAELAQLDEAAQQAGDDAERQAQLRQWEFEQAFARMVDTPDGRRVVWWMLEIAHLYDTSFDPQILGSQSERCSFLEGERNIGLRVFAQITQHPDAYSKMLEEQSGRRHDPDRD